MKSLALKVFVLTFCISCSDDLKEASSTISSSGTTIHNSSGTEFAKAPASKLGTTTPCLDLVASPKHLKYRNEAESCQTPTTILIDGRHVRIDVDAFIEFLYEVSSKKYYSQNNQRFYEGAHLSVYSQGWPLLKNSMAKLAGVYQTLGSCMKISSDISGASVSASTCDSRPDSYSLKGKSFFARDLLKSLAAQKKLPLTGDNQIDFDLLRSY